jgi:hypothetical protein
MRCLLLLLAGAAVTAHSIFASTGVVKPLVSRADTTSAWPRGGSRACGTLRTPGAAYGGRRDETDHWCGVLCLGEVSLLFLRLSFSSSFPADAADHFVCCVDIQSVGNAHNRDDPSVARYNPLEARSLKCFTLLEQCRPHASHRAPSRATATRAATPGVCAVSPYARTS